MELNDPATVEFDLGQVPSLWRQMHFKFQANNQAPSKVRIMILDTQSKRAPAMLVTMGEDGVKNLREMCDKALAYFERMRNASSPFAEPHTPGRPVPKLPAE